MPPPKIVGRGIQSKLINTESGKRLYASEMPYQEQMQKLSQKYVLDVQLVKESEFKKPYLEDDYGEMEHFQNPGFEDPEFPSGPGQFNKDCEVGYEVAGAVEGWRICAPADDCAGWVFTCAHKIVSFSCGNCQIVKLERLPGDKVLVVICSKSDALDVKFLTNDGKTNMFRQGRTCLGTGPNPGCSSCADCKTYPPAIGYTTQQMSTSGAGSTQNLNADGGGGGPYTWSIISGGGSLAKTTTTNNEMNLYTAPSSNANCTNNPTIQVKDYCGNTATLKIAVNGYTLTQTAYRVVHLSQGSLPCTVTCGPDSAVNQTILNNGAYNCVGTFLADSPLCGRCVCSSALCGTVCYVPGTSCTPCTQATIGCNPLYCPDGCTLGTTHDDRTPTMLTGGCCPSKFL